MMLIPPVEQFSNNYVTIPTFELNYVTIYGEPDYFQLGKFYIDENNLSNSVPVVTIVSGCLTTPDVYGYFTRVNLTTPGDHRLYHLDQNARLGVSVYGFRIDYSYGYPGGMKLRPLRCKN